MARWNGFLDMGDYVRVYTDNTFIVFDANGNQKHAGKMGISEPVNFETRYCEPFFTETPKGYLAHE